MNLRTEIRSLENYKLTEIRSSEKIKKKNGNNFFQKDKEK